MTHVTGAAANGASRPKSVRIRIKRQASPTDPVRWEEFELPFRQGMNVIVALQDIQKKPVAHDGSKTTPVSFQASCLEEVCGSCTMLINGKARLACSALVQDLPQPITLEPLSKFPVIRDLAVDRSAIFEAFKRVRAWVPIDGTYDLGPGPRVAPETQEVAYPLSRCIACAACMEVCPQYNERTEFVGAAAINQARLMNLHPTGAMHRRDRLRALMGPGGIQTCGDAQNCVRACPKEIPLTESIADMFRQTTKELVRGWLGR
jgi:succinate dehydrogenase / fumarate reductase iron-sulfur subunit